MQKSADTEKKLPLLKPILALPTCGQICIVLELQPFEIPDFDLGHPVNYFNQLKLNKSKSYSLGGLIIQKQRKYDLIDLRTFNYPLKMTVWAGILGSVSIIVVARIIARNSIDSTTFLDVAWESFAPYFGGWFQRELNERNSYKILTFVTLFCGNIIWMSYQASLTVDLSSPTTKIPFSNLETFSETNWNIYTTSK